MSRLLRHPLLHFLALGALLLAVDAQRPAAEAGGPASDEALLLGQARARGLQHSDALVRQRLVRNMRFLGADPEQSDAELFAEALALGMDESDPVVRRRLAQRVSLEVAAEARRREPQDAELLAYLQRHPERFALPCRVRLSQRFLGPGSLPLPAHWPGASRRELADAFGEPFADAVFALEPGPEEVVVASSYGSHSVRLEARTGARRARLSEVRGALRQALLAERATRALEEEIAWLRARR